MGVAGTIFHVGSHLGAGFDGAMVERIGRMLGEVLADEPDNPSLLILENNAGQGNCIGGKFGELGAIIRAVGGHPQVAVCIDTCHAYAMGYDLATAGGCAAAMEEFDREVGFARLAAVHANDTKQPLGTFRDRHENIGEGHIGAAGFRTLMAHPAFRDVPFLLEVPGFDGGGPDAKNVRRLKKIRSELGIEAPKLPPISRLAKAR
jgi:deoxyribonuclease-4